MLYRRREDTGTDHCRFMIHYGLQDGRYVVRKGSTITLECRAAGNPRPTISWRKKVQNGTSRYSMNAHKEALFFISTVNLWLFL
jgi:hypothetical protein